MGDGRPMMTSTTRSIAGLATALSPKPSKRCGAAGVPAQPVVRGHDINLDPQMQARGFWEELDHPFTGTQCYSGFPFGLRADRWFRRPAPLLGQDNDAVLGEIGLSPEDIAALRDEQVVGERMLGL